jgi:transcription antitermination factor NusG
MKKWHVGYFYHGYLKQLHDSFEKQEVRFRDVEMWYPQTSAIVIKDGIREEVKKPVFDNYVLFQFEEGSLIWGDIIRFTPIIKFLKNEKDNCLAILSDDEVENLKAIESKKIIPNYSSLINKDVMIVRGPFKGMIGRCQSIIKGLYKARISINMYDIVERKVEIDLEDLELFN